MDLYIFGFGNNKQIPLFCYDYEDASSVYSPFCAIRNSSLKILWASWCDLIIATFPEDSSGNHGRISYFGNSLRKEQVAYIESISYDPANPIVFFGRHADHGVRGFIQNHKHELAIFSIEEEMLDGVPPVVHISYASENWDISDIKFTSMESVLVNTHPRSIRTSQGGIIVDIPSLNHFTSSLLERNEDIDKMQLPLYNSARCKFAPTQWCTNTTTFTALDVAGKVYTYASDRRFPKCVGRALTVPLAPHEEDHALQIPYFEESTVQKIASGGYYSAAIADGELYIWGQACPGVDHELTVLAQEPTEDDDEFIRYVELKYQGRRAIATDVAIGPGHILVAVEVNLGEGRLARTMFAAGQNNRGQLGLGTRPMLTSFVEDFTEVIAFRDKKIIDMVCAGWSSYVVVEDAR